MRARQDIMLRDPRSAMAPYQAPPGAMLPHDMPEPSLIAAIFRHFWIVVLCAVIAGAAAIVYLNKATPYYTSESSIYIQPAGPRVLSENLESAQRSNYLYTQAQVITSTPILELVVDTPGIKDLHTFDIAHGNALYYLRDQLDAEVDRRTDVITISISSPYPEDAAKIVNATVDAYNTYQTQSKKTNTSSLLDTLQTTREQKVADLRSVQDQITAFKHSHPNLNLDQVFTAELTTVATNYTAAQLATIEARSTYGPGHPALQRAQQREQDLYQQYHEKLDQLMKLNTVNADYQALASQLTEKDTFVKQLDQRINELQATLAASQIINDVQVLEPAHVADRPSFPRKYRTLGVSIFAGMLLGAGLALLRDRMDGRMRSVEEIQMVVGLPILGVVPAMNGRRTAIARAMTVHLDPRSVVAEAYRTIRTAVYFGANEANSKTILVTSPEPGDGKTTSASNLAIAIAQTGRSVLLLDADFRKPTQHKNLDIKDAVGLSSVLAGRETLDKAIQHTGVEGLDILPCGPIPANPSEILNSREFGELIDSLSQRYDHILFDSPPVNAVTDARILGAVCDATILVLRADKSTRKATEHARNAMLAVGARTLGAIVNDAPNRKGYEVYGGYYYGGGPNTDMSPRPYNPNGNGNGQKRLPREIADVAG